MSGIVALDKLNVASNNYQDPEDVAYGQWAVSATCSVADGNLVTPYVNGPDAFFQMAMDFETAKTNEHFIYITGFETSPTTPMGGSTLGDLLRAAAGRGVMVRGIFNGDGMRRNLGRPFKDNMPLRNHIRAIGGEAFMDDHCGLAGSHHQKIVVIQGESGLVAYCGGIDLHDARASATGWHDVHCRLVGPAAYDLFQTFDERWSDNAGLISSVTSPLIAPMKQAAVGGNVTTYSVQIAHTYPALVNALPYAPYGRREVISMLTNAIRRSTTFIYVEDQFAVCHASVFVDELKTRLAAPAFKYLIIVTLSNSGANGSLVGQAEYRRKLLLDDLKAVAPDKVIAVVRHDLYVHAKTWIFDDKFAIIGSANMNNRGYFSDGEVVAGIADKNQGGTRLWLAHQLRMALWMKHLDLAEKDVLNVDQALVDKWKVATGKIEPLDPVPPAGASFSDGEWAVIDPRV